MANKTPMSYLGMMERHLESSAMAIVFPEWADVSQDREQEYAWTEFETPTHDVIQRTDCDYSQARPWPKSKGFKKLIGNGFPARPTRTPPDEIVLKT